MCRSGKCPDPARSGCPVVGSRLLRKGHSTRSDFHVFAKCSSHCDQILAFALRFPISAASDFRFWCLQFCLRFWIHFLGGAAPRPYAQKVGSKNRIQNWIHFGGDGGPALRGTILEDPFTKFVIKNRIQKSAYRSSGRNPCVTLL